MHQTPLRVLLLSIVVISALAGRAAAQSAEAEGLFNEGDRMMASGKIAEACDAFEASNRIEQRAGTLVRLGECREQNHQIASAWSAYKDALTRAKDPRKREIASAKAAALEPRLSYLTVSVPEESRVDGLQLTRNGQLLDRGLWNRAVPIDGGTYVIGGRAPGHEEWTVTVEVPVESGKASVDVPKFKEIAKLVELSKTDGDEETDEPRPAKLWTPKRKIAVGLGAGSVLALATGAVLGVQAHNKQSSADALCPDPSAPCRDALRADDLNHSGHTFALGADAALGLGAGLAIAAGVLWFVGAPEQATTVAITPHVTSDHIGFAIGGSF
jgi:hypothetical protein